MSEERQHYETLIKFMQTNRLDVKAPNLYKYVYEYQNHIAPRKDTINHLNQPQGWIYNYTLFKIQDELSYHQIANVVKSVQLSISQQDQFVKYCTNKYQIFNFDILNIQKVEQIDKTQLVQYYQISSGSYKDQIYYGQVIVINNKFEPHGIGVLLQLAKQIIQIGTFKYGKEDGRQRVIHSFPPKERQYLEFTSINGNLHGDVLFEKASGKVVKGTYFNNKQHGKWEYKYLNNRLDINIYNNGQLETRKTHQQHEMDKPSETLQSQKATQNRQHQYFERRDEDENLNSSRQLIPKMEQSKEEDYTFHKSQEEQSQELKKEEKSLKKKKIQMSQQEKMNRPLNKVSKISASADSFPNPKRNSRRLRKYDDDNSEDEEQELEDQSMKYFHKYRNIFQNLLKRESIQTACPVISVILSYDETRVITVTKKDDSEYRIKQYDLCTLESTFQETIGGDFENDFIKLQEIEQTQDGRKYALVYNNDGIFYVRSFGRETRSLEQIEHAFPQPSATCCFVNDNLLFVVLFYNAKLTHYHMLIDLQTGQVVNSIKHQITCTKQNFPYRCFYCAPRNELYSIYRQGNAYIIDGDDLNSFEYSDITDADLGHMILVEDRALIAQSSSEILFFKIQKTAETGGRRMWSQYTELKIMGFVYQVKDTLKIYVTTENKIYFYIINNQTLMPILENVIQNYMGCSQMMFSNTEKYCVTYKMNMKSVEVYRRKYLSDFKVTVSYNDHEGALGVDLPRMNCFLVTQIDKIIMFDSDTYEQIDQLPIELLKSQTREETQIIALIKTDDDEYLAALSGKPLIMNQYKIDYLYIFQRKVNGLVHNNQPRDNFELYKRILVQDIPLFQKISTDFHFKKAQLFEQNAVILATQEGIYEMNLSTECIVNTYKFEIKLDREPQVVCPTPDQQVFIVSSFENSLYCNVQQGYEFDIDSEYSISSVQTITYDGDAISPCFYLLVNTYREDLGFYILRIPKNAPSDGRFIIQWKLKLDIGNANIYILRNKETFVKELLVSYKVIYMNTYNVINLDISIDDRQRILFRHESFHLWEESIMGFLGSNCLHFVTVGKQGIQVMCFDSCEKRIVKDNQMNEWILHSLEAYDYLKLDPGNCLRIEGDNQSCGGEHDDHANAYHFGVSIQQEYKVWNKSEKHQLKGRSDADLESMEEDTNFWCLYKIKLHSIKLRELLLFQSLYLAKSLTELNSIIMYQPNPTIFYKSYLDLDTNNMISILSFDSRSLGYLLSPQFEKHFSSKFPMFYKNKYYKGIKDGKPAIFYRSAIDNALRLNQARACQLIIEYMVKYQNNFTSSFLFYRNLLLLIQKGIYIKNLLDSDIFSFHFDYDEWPTVHTHRHMYMRPCNENIFMIKNHYRTIFPEDVFDPIDALEGTKTIDSGKIFQISYNVNLLPNIGAHHERTIDLFTKEEKSRVVGTKLNFLTVCCYESDEISMFESLNLKEFIEFKWGRYAFKYNLFGFVIHILYLFFLIVYVQSVYVTPSSRFSIQSMLPDDSADEVRLINASVLLAFIIYPVCYEVLQMYTAGLDYLTDIGNYFDIVYIWGSVGMIILHMTYDAKAWFCRAMMIIVIVLSVRRTFAYLRIFHLYTPIITMLSGVFYDLRIFLAVYFILITLLALVYEVLGMINENVPGRYQDEFKDVFDSGRENLNHKLHTAAEFYHIGKLFAMMIQTIRISFADYDLISGVKYLEWDENIIFWVIFLVTLGITTIIFLNYIVAEACSCYQKVKSLIECHIESQKAEMVAEAQTIIPESFMNDQRFPRYILIRKQQL